MAVTTMTMTVPLTAHVALLGAPSEPPAELWYVCHGYGQLAHRFIKRFEALASADRVVVAPEGLSRFYVRGAGGTVGASWMTREDREEEIADYVRFLDALYDELVAAWGGPPRRVVVLGFSQGCATASRWVARGAVVVDRVVLWGGLPAHDLTDADLTVLADRRAPVALVVGDQDATVPPAGVREAESGLAAGGVPTEVIRYRGGHEIDPATLLRVAAGGDT